MTATLQGKHVAFPAADGVEEVEHTKPADLPAVIVEEFAEGTHSRR